MTDLTILLSLIGALYDGALNREDWARANEAISDAFGGAAIMAGIYRRGEPPTAIGDTGLDLSYMPAFVERYATPETNALIPWLATVPVGRTTFREEIQADDEYRMSGVFNDVMRPQGLLHFAAVCVERNPRAVVPFTLHRRADQPPFDESERALLDALAPHLRRALQLRAHLAVLEQETLSLAAVFDRMIDGVILVDDGGRVVVTNPAADMLVAAQDGLAITDRIPVAALSDETAASGG